MSKTVTGIIVIVLIALTGFGAWYFMCLSTTYSGTPEPITIGMQPIETNALIFIAEDQGFFTSNGLNVTIKNYGIGAQAAKGMENDEVDISSSAEYPIVIAAFQKGNISLIGCIDKFQVMNIAGRKDQGIENVSDLKGKMIGVSRRAIGEFYLGRFLDLHGISLQDVILADIPTNPQLMDALTNGSVDAIVIPDNCLDPIKGKLGDNIVVWSVQNSQAGFDVLAGRNDWIASHLESVNRLLKSLNQAEKYAIEHPDEAKTIVQKRLNYTDTYMAIVWPHQQLSLTLDQSLITAMEDEGRWTIANNLTSEKTLPDYSAFIYSQGLEDVKPEAVNIR